MHKYTYNLAVKIPTRPVIVYGEPTETNELELRGILQEHLSSMKAWITRETTRKRDPKIFAEGAIKKRGSILRAKLEVWSTFPPSLFGWFHQQIIQSSENVRCQYSFFERGCGFTQTTVECVGELAARHPEKWEYAAFMIGNKVEQAVEAGGKPLSAFEAAQLAIQIETLKLGIIQTDVAKLEHNRRVDMDLDTKRHRRHMEQIAKESADSSGGMSERGFTRAVQKGVERAIRR